MADPIMSVDTSTDAVEALRAELYFVDRAYCSCVDCDAWRTLGALLTERTTLEARVQALETELAKASPASEWGGPNERHDDVQS